MSAVALTFLGGQYALVARLRGGATCIEVSEAVSAAAFAMLGVGGLIASGVFFENFIAKGQSGLLTGGFIPLTNVAVGAEAAASAADQSTIAATCSDQQQHDPPTRQHRRNAFQSESLQIAPSAADAAQPGRRRAPANDRSPAGS